MKSNEEFENAIRMKAGELLFLFISTLGIYTIYTRSSHIYIYVCVFVLLNFSTIPMVEPKKIYNVWQSHKTPPVKKQIVNNSSACSPLFALITGDIPTSPAIGRKQPYIYTYIPGATLASNVSLLGGRFAPGVSGSFWVC